MWYKVKGKSDCDGVILSVYITPSLEIFKEFFYYKKFMPYFIQFQNLIHDSFMERLMLSFKGGLIKFYMGKI